MQDEKKKYTNLNKILIIFFSFKLFSLDSKKKEQQNEKLMNQLSLNYSLKFHSLFIIRLFFNILKNPLKMSES